MPHTSGDVMPDRPIAFDLSRLVTRLTHPTPTGIDRVDLAYARRILDGSAARHAVLTTALGPRVVRPAAAAALLAALDTRWADTGEAEADPVFLEVASKLGLPLQDKRRASHPRAGRSLRLEAALLAGSRSINALPHGVIYVHTSHLRLDRPAKFAWLTERRDSRAVFFVHDLIPVLHPEFSRPGEDERHRTRLATIARHADAVIVNSAAVKDALTSYWTNSGTKAPPIVVAPLGVEPAFIGSAPGALGESRFFVACGTIEPRKNHAHLLHIWRRLADDGGPVPKLVIAGRRGWESESVIDILDRASFVREHVLEAAGLSTPALVRLMQASRGVLMPSFTEGYGLPVVEALSLGVPVIASDIAVHREVAGQHAVFVDPIDGPGWISAIRRLAGLSDRQNHVGAPFKPPTWAAHFRLASTALQAAAR